MEGPPQAKNHLFCYLGLTHTPPRGGGVFPDLSEVTLYPGFLSEMESYGSGPAWLGIWRTSESPRRSPYPHTTTPPPY